VTGSVADWSKIDTVVIHYTAAADVPDGDRPDEVAAYLRAIQQDYVTNPNRGYSIGYMFAVDQHGGQWQLRGWEYRSAANNGHNDHTMPILCLVDGDRAATAVAVDAVRRLVAEGARRAGRELAIVGHGDIGATSCPGVGLAAQVRAGVFTPVTEPDPVPPTSEDVQMIAIYRPAWYATEPNAAWLCASGGAVRPATSFDVQWAAGNGVPVIDVVDRVQYANLVKAAGL
jgi:hypothetical protein